MTATATATAIGPLVSVTVSVTVYVAGVSLAGASDVIMTHVVEADLVRVRLLREPVQQLLVAQLQRHRVRPRSSRKRGNR